MSSFSAGSDSDDESSSGPDSDADAPFHPPPKRARPSTKPRPRAKPVSSTAAQPNSLMPTAEQLESTVVNSNSSNPAPSCNSQSSQKSRSLHYLNSPANAQNLNEHSGRKSKRPPRKLVSTSYSPPTNLLNGVSITISHSKSPAAPRLNGHLSASLGVGVGPLEQPGSPTSSVPSLGELSSADDSLSDSPAPRANHVSKSPSAAASRVQFVHSVDLLQHELPNASSRVKHESTELNFASQSQSLPAPAAKPKPRTRARAKFKAQEPTNEHEPDAASSAATAPAEASAAPTGAVSGESKSRKRARDGRKRTGGARQHAADPFASQESTPAALNALLARIQARPSSKARSHSRSGAGSGSHSRAAGAPGSSGTVAQATDAAARVPAAPPTLPTHCCICLGDSSDGLLQRCASCSLSVHSGTSTNCFSSGF